MAGTDCRLEGPNGEPGSAWGPIVTGGGPVQVVLYLRNRSGLDQLLPASCLGDGALRSGIEAHLFYSPTSPDPETYVLSLQGGEPRWSEVPARPVTHDGGSGGARRVAPGESYRALQAELRTRLDLRRPGFYRFFFSFSGRPTGFADGRSNEVGFEVGSDTRQPRPQRFVAASARPAPPRNSARYAAQIQTQ